MYIHNVCICTCRWYTQRKIKQDQWYKRSCEKLNKRKILKRPCGSKFHRQRSYDWSGPPTDRRLHGRECLPICRVSHTSDWVATTQTDAHARFLLTDRPTMKSSTPVLWLDKDHAFYQLHDVVSKHGWHKEHYEQRPDHTVISQQSLTNSHRHKRGTHTLSCFAGIRLIDLSAWLSWCCFNFRPSSCWTGNAKALPVVKHILADLRTVCV